MDPKTKVDFGASCINVPQFFVQYFQWTYMNFIDL